MNNIKISVVTPVYNTKEEHLREAIESILNQTYPNFEFILLNDGSTNNVEDVILSYNDSRIKYFKQEHKGLVKSRNKLIDLSRGEYIVVLDHDDIALPERLEKQLNFLESNPDISLVGSWVEFFGEQNWLRVVPENVTYFRLLNYDCIHHPAVMYRKADFEKYNLRYDENYEYADDYELYSRAIRFLKMANIQEVLLKYRWHSGNASNVYGNFQQGKDVQIKQNMLNFLTYNPALQHKIMECIEEAFRNKLV